MCSVVEAWRSDEHDESHASLDDHLSNDNSDSNNDNDNDDLVGREGQWQDGNLYLALANA
jgi:hypothetical protein